MDDLNRGARNAFVTLMQRLLNKAGRSDRAGAVPLILDGVFGPLTEAAVRDFQARRRFAQTGTCDSRVWTALGCSIDIRHDRIQIMGQPTDTSCWATAAAMILGNMFPTIDDSHLTDDGQLRADLEHVAAFGNALGWGVPNHTPDVAEALGWLRMTPLWMACTGSDFGHALVWSGAFGDGTPSGTLLRFHDPWPPGFGRVYTCFLDDLHEIADSGQRIPMSLHLLLVPR